jgi:hypothetical protein
MMLICSAKLANFESDHSNERTNTLIFANRTIRNAADDSSIGNTFAASATKTKLPMIHIHVEMLIVFIIRVAEIFVTSRFKIVETV